jgi:hypothetical protein
MTYNAENDVPTDAASVRAAAGLGLRWDCPRCSTRHLISCCHASRHNLCDRCVAEQHEARFLRLMRERLAKQETPDA